MFLDRQNEFSDSQVVTTTAISTNVIDTLAGNSFTNVIQNLGGFAGSCFLVVQIDVAFAGGTSLAYSLESDSTVGLATSPTVHYSSGAIALASLTPAGKTLGVIPLPYGDYERYLGVRYTIVGTMSGGGAISAFLTRDPQTWKPYAVAQASNL